MSFDTPELRAIGERLRTQDNRCTKDPLFQVRGLRRIYGMDPDHGDDKFEWISVVDDFIVVDPPEDEDNPPEGVEKLYYITVEEVLMSGLTEAACKEHLRCNGHRYRSFEKLFIYTDTLFRNPEMIAIRNALIALPPPD
jgi:hypothetical protein